MVVFDETKEIITKKTNRVQIELNKSHWLEGEKKRETTIGEKIMAPKPFVAIIHSLVTHTYFV